MIVNGGNISSDNSNDVRSVGHTNGVPVNSMPDGVSKWRIFFNTSDPTMSSVTSMNYMFESDESLKSINLSGLDTSHVTSMYYMFGFNHSLKNVNLSGMNTSALTTIGSMFTYDDSLISVNLSGIDFSHIPSFDSLFYHDSLLRSINLSGLKINSSQQSTSRMFSDVYLTGILLSSDTKLSDDTVGEGVLSGGNTPTIGSDYAIWDASHPRNPSDDPHKYDNDPEGKATLSDVLDHPSADPNAEVGPNQYLYWIDGADIQHDVPGLPRVNEHINYDWFGRSVGSTKVSGIKNSSSNISNLHSDSIDSDWHVNPAVKNNTFVYNNGTYNVEVSPDTIQQNINYEYKGDVIGHHQFSGFDYHTKAGHNCCTEMNFSNQGNYSDSNGNWIYGAFQSITIQECLKDLKSLILIKLLILMARIM